MLFFFGVKYHAAANGHAFSMISLEKTVDCLSESG